MTLSQNKNSEKLVSMYVHFQSCEFPTHSASIDIPDWYQIHKNLGWNYVLSEHSSLAWMRHTDTFIFRLNEQPPSNTQVAKTGNPNGENPGSSVSKSIIPDTSNLSFAPSPEHTKGSATTPLLVIPAWRYFLSFLSDVYLCESLDLNTSRYKLTTSSLHVLVSVHLPDTNSLLFLCLETRHRRAWACPSFRPLTHVAFFVIPPQLLIRLFSSKYASSLLCDWFHEHSTRSEYPAASVIDWNSSLLCTQSWWKVGPCRHCKCYFCYETSCSLVWHCQWRQRRWSSGDELVASFMRGVYDWRDIWINSYRFGCPRFIALKTSQ